MYILVFLAGLFFMGCSEDYLNINKTNHAIAKFVTKKYKLKTFSSGVSAPNKIHYFSLDFVCDKQYCLDEARKLVVEIVEDILIRIDDPIVLNALEAPPLNEMHLDLGIIFINSNEDYYSDLSDISLWKGKIIYSKFFNNCLNEFYAEPYSEAYFKVYGTYRPERGN